MTHSTAEISYAIMVGNIEFDFSDTDLLSTQSLAVYKHIKKNYGSNNPFIKEYEVYINAGYLGDDRIEKFLIAKKQK